MCYSFGVRLIFVAWILLGMCHEDTLHFGLKLKLELETVSIVGR